MKNNSILIFRNFNDPILKTAWIKLENEIDAFPQMFYEWIEPWWRYNSRNRKLHIVAVVNECGKIVGIAPFCIEKRFGLKILRSIPIHFGDFYSMLVDHGNVGELICQIKDYTLTFKTWSIVHYYNINSSSIEALNLKAFKKRKITDILVTHFERLTLNQFLLSLSKNTRDQYKKKLNRLNKAGLIQLEVITDPTDYIRNFENTREIYNLRWANDLRPLLSDDYYSMRNEALLPMFRSGKAVLYNLRFNGSVIAFRLGFLHKNTFYDWKVSHDPKYDYYSPGFILVGKVIEDLMLRGYVRLNFMTGNYRYKRSWINNNTISSNFEFLSSKKYSLGVLYIFYRLHLREKVREFYYKWVKIIISK